jgi:2-methylcitrate dehydratase PrpD
MTSDPNAPDTDPVPDYAADYATFAATLTLDRLPAAAIAAVKTNLFDTMACAVAGLSATGVRPLQQLVIDWGGKPEATVWCRSVRVPAHHAALVNGMMAHARDYDDTHDAAVLHAGVSVIPAAIAAAERDPTATGADVIAGIAAGLELICRLGMATTVGPVESGFIYTALLGHFAATAAAARVMRFDQDRTANALGIAYSQAAGTHQVTRDATLTKRIQPGFAAQTGLLSVAMAQIGIRGASRPFEGVDGLFRTYLRGQFNPAPLRAGLGAHYEFLNLSYKPYPCCRYTHTAIDAALKLREELGGDVSSVRRVTVLVNRDAYEAVCTPVAMRKAPSTVVQAQFSIPFTVACALVKGSVSLEDLTDAGLQDPAVRDLAARIDSQIGEEIERDWSRGVSPARVLVELNGGTLEQQVDYPRGHPAAPTATRDFDRKLASCQAISGIRWPPESAVRLRAAIDGLEHSPSGASAIAPLTG